MKVNGIAQDEQIKLEVLIESLIAQIGAYEMVRAPQHLFDELEAAQAEYRRRYDND